jgi:hypothetical protein
MFYVFSFLNVFSLFVGSAAKKQWATPKKNSLVPLA